MGTKPQEQDRHNIRAADLRLKIITKLEYWNPCQLPRLSGKVPSEDLLEDVSAALQTIIVGNITETKKLTYIRITTDNSSDPRDTWIQDRHEYNLQGEAKIKATQKKKLASNQNYRQLNKDLPRK